MRQLLRRLLLAAVLLFAQHAAMLHGLAHAQHEVALAEQGNGKAPALGHGADKCVAFSALAHALGNAAIAQPAGCILAGAPAVAHESVPAATRIAFDSRAPPTLS